MKKNMISTVMCVVAFATFLTACDDSLETKNFTDMSPSNFFNTEGDFDAAVTGLYLPLTTNWGTVMVALVNGTIRFSMPISTLILLQVW